MRMSPSSTRRAPTHIDAGTGKPPRGDGTCDRRLPRACRRRAQERQQRQAMQSTAVGLLDSSKQASQRAESAVKASIEASANVSTAATAATELSASIAEIGHQLTRASEVVRVTVTEAETTNQQIAGLADAAQKIGDGGETH